jgi:predicted RNase H-like nuclease (RuvC/YqgF family)
MADVQERLEARIHGLLHRGTHICPEFVPSSSLPMACNLCSYTPEIHLLRDALADLARVTEELKAEREKHDEEAYTDMKAAKESAERELDRLRAQMEALIVKWREWAQKQRALSALQRDSYSEAVLTCAAELDAALQAPRPEQTGDTRKERG